MEVGGEEVSRSISQQADYSVPIIIRLRLSAILVNVFSMASKEKVIQRIL